MTERFCDPTDGRPLPPLPEESYPPGAKPLSMRELNRIAVVGEWLLGSDGGLVLIDGERHKCTDCRVYVDGWSVSAATWRAEEQSGICFCHDQDVNGQTLYDLVADTAKQVVLHGRVVIFASSEAIDRDLVGEKIPNPEAERIATACRASSSAPA